jgi:hypothetical protein
MFSSWTALASRSLFVFLLLAGSSRTAPPLQAGVTITEEPDRLTIHINGEHFADYRYQGASRPFLYPMIGPEGLRLTRDWPMKDGVNEDKDHPHHQSFWFAHGDVNGIDFWSESAAAGRTVHDSFLQIESGPKAGVIQSATKLIAKDGKTVATEMRTMRIYNESPHRLMDFEITIRGAGGELRFGDTKEGTLALRLAETMRLKPNKFNAGKPTGHIVNSEGVRDGETWGKRARWVDYYGPVEGKTLGVAIFDHPTNPRHPTWWHVRDYGLFAANPFGLSDFEKQPKGSGDLVVKAGEAVTFRYRIYVHLGDEQAGQVEQRYQDYVKSVK